jgi:hypothetical protein
MKSQIIKNFFQTRDGVDIHLKGDILKSEYIQKIEACSVEGGCDCDCSELKKDIEDISISGDDGHVVISLKGKLIDKDKIMTAMQTCEF